MKRTLIVVVCSVMSATALFCQTAEKAGVKSAGLGKQDAASNEELNIRAYIELLRSETRDTKTQVIADVMALDAAQAAKFWPIYKEFEAEFTGIGNKMIALVKSYAEHYTEMTDAAADRLANEALSIEQQRNALKKKYYDRFKEGVGAITATRFLQVENQLERIIDLQVTAQLPVIGEK